MDVHRLPSRVGGDADPKGERKLVAPCLGFRTPYRQPRPMRPGSRGIGSQRAAGKDGKHPQTACNNPERRDGPRHCRIVVAVNARNPCSRRQIITGRRATACDVRGDRESASPATSPAHASIETIGHSLDKPGVRSVISPRSKLHLNAAVRQCFQRGCDRNAAPLALDHAGAAILCRDRQALIVHCPIRSRTRIARNAVAVSFAKRRGCRRGRRRRRKPITWQKRKSADAV